MKFTIQNFVHILAHQSKSNLGVVRLLIIIEFVQNIGLCLPKHGWEQLKYSDQMLSSIQQVTNYTLFQHSSHTDDLVESVTICIALVYFIGIGFYALISQQQKTTQLISFSLNITMKTLRLPLLVLYINFLNRFKVKVIWIVLDTLSFGVFLLISILTIYFQRDLSINLSRKYYPLNSLYSPIQYIIFLLDIFRVMIVILLSQKAGSVLFYLMTILEGILKIFQNLKNQCDEDKFLQSIHGCNIVVSLLLLFMLSTNLDEMLLFNLLLYLITILFYIFQLIDLQKFFKSTSIIHQIQLQMKKNMMQKFLKANNKYQSDLEYSDSLRLIVEKEISQNQYQYNEENVLFVHDYLIKNSQSYFQGLFLLNKFECTSGKLSFFYNIMSAIFKTQIQQCIQKSNNSTLMIQTLNKDIILESEYQRKYTNVILSQIKFYDHISQECKNLQQIEEKIILISKNIMNTKIWLEKNHILQDRNNFTYLKIQMNFYSQVMQHYVQAFKLKQKISQITNKDQQTVEAIHLMKSKSVVVTLSLIKQKGAVLNINKSILHFFGFHSAGYKLEFIDQLLPETIQPYHQLFVERYVNRNEGNGNYQQTTLQVLQQQENGLLQCLEVNIVISNDNTDFVLIALLKKVNQHKGYIIFDSTGKIIGVNEHFFTSNELYQQMRLFNYIQYFCPDIFAMLNNKEFQVEKEISLVNRANLSKIDKKYRNYVQSQNKTITQMQNSNFEYICSDRSERFSLLNLKNNYSDKDIIIFDILDTQYQDKLIEIINSNISLDDITLKYKVVISRIVFEEKLLQYQMEFILLEAKAAHEEDEENENLKENLPKFNICKPNSGNDVSVVSSNQKASEILHEIISKQSNNQFKSFYLYSFLIMIIVVAFFIIQILQVQLDFNTKVMYVGYISVPQSLNWFFTHIFNYGFNEVIYQDLNKSNFLVNQFQNTRKQELLLFRKQYQTLQFDLIQIESKGFGFTYPIQMQNIQLTADQFSPFAQLIKDNLIIILTYDVTSREYVESIIFFRLNLITAYNVTLTLSNNFSQLLQNYSTDLMTKWQYILSSYITLSIFPFLIILRKWYSLEKKHRIIIQIMTRITQEQAYRCIDCKKSMIQYMDIDKDKVTQSLHFESSRRSQQTWNMEVGHTYRSQRQIVSTINNQTQNLRQRDTQYLYEKVKNKKITIMAKIVIATFFYFIIVAVGSFGYIQIKKSDADTLPIQTLMQTYTNFLTQLNFLISSTSVMKGQQFFQNQISKIDDVGVNNVTSIFLNDDLPTYFSTISKTYSKKIISIFSSIILSDQIDESYKNTLYSLYKSDFCLFISEELPFCDLTLSNNQFAQEYGNYYEYENNSDVLRIGIMGYVSRLSSLLKNNFNAEMSTSTYSNNLSQDIFYQQDYNNLITQYSFSIFHGFDLFALTVNSIEQSLITKTKNNLLTYFISFQIAFLAIFSLVSLGQIQMASNRYNTLLLALVTLSDDLLNEKTNLASLKRLNC